MRKEKVILNEYKGSMKGDVQFWARVEVLRLNGKQQHFPVHYNDKILNMFL